MKLTKVLSIQKKFRILVIVLLVFIIILIYQRGIRPSSAEKYISEMNEKYEADRSGGITPEETLSLFIDFLKNDQLQLAAAFFVPEAQTAALSVLEKLKSDGVISDLVSDLSRARIENRGPKSALLVISNQNQEVLRTIDFVFVREKWKFLRF